MEKFKKNVVDKTLVDDTFRDPMLINKMMMDVWPDDPEVSQAFNKLKARQERPSGWKGIEYYQKLAFLNPLQCKNELKAYRETPFVFLGYGKELHKIDKRIDELQVQGLSQTLSQAYSLGPVGNYEEKMREIISMYKLNWQLDDIVNWFEELKKT